jgi:hypothetical protein
LLQEFRHFRWWSSAQLKERHSMVKKSW